MSSVKVIAGRKCSIKVVNTSESEQREYISSRDLEMDERASAAVKSAVNKAVVCKKPLAKYDAVAKKVYVEYASGEKKYVE